MSYTFIGDIVVENEEIDMQSYSEYFYTEENEEIGMQFKKAEEYREANFISTENYQIATHSQAIYTSRLLNPFTKDLPKCNDDDNSQCLD
ncbi:unnamed protein product [Rhizophagus irregularis]|nr:unnamed protein product [Rhizophagus irregularis]